MLVTIDFKLPIYTDYKVLPRVQTGAKLSLVEIWITEKRDRQMD